jgi:hypothetical protein
VFADKTFQPHLRLLFFDHHADDGSLVESVTSSVRDRSGQWMGKIELQGEFGVSMVCREAFKKGAGDTE